MYRVLIVDDEKMIRMGMKNAIECKREPAASGAGFLPETD